MDFAIIERVVEAFLPLGLTEIIPSTIGEPFLYSHFEDFLKLAKKHNLKVNITTNGTFPNGISPLLFEVLSDIKFSAMHGKIPKSIFDFIGKKSLSNLRNFNNFSGSPPIFFRPQGELGERRWLQKNNFTVSIQATLSENDILDEIPAGVDRVKINAPWILGQKKISGNCELGDCPFLGKHIWVWVDGTFQVCPNPDARFAKKTKFPFGDFGNFAYENPIEIWNGARYANFCKNYKENIICKDCSMRCIVGTVNKL